MANYSSIYSEMESEVRSYCRKFPVEFSKARNSELFTKDGTRYIDFFNMAGSLNYVPAKSLQVSKGVIIGIKTWGKIDFLTHYCGWTLKPSAE